MENSGDVNWEDLNIPESFLVDLEELGIEEVDRGTCLDTYENRQILRQSALTWRDVYTNDGSPTDYIVAVSPELTKFKTLQKGMLLTDSRDPNADYETGVDLLLVSDVHTLVPGWVIGATKKWNQVVRDRERTGKNVTPHLVEPPGRCIGIRMNGQRCRNWHGGRATDGSLCKMHLGRHGMEANTVAKAKNRILSGAVAAVTQLERLMDDATSEQVRLKASTELLDRAGIRGGIEIDQKVEIEVQPAAMMISERLRKLGTNTPEKLEAAVTDTSTTHEDVDVTDAVVVEQEEDEHE